MGELLITTPLGFRGVGDGRSGARWTVEKLSGWFERGGVKQERQARPWGDGNFDAPAFREGKLPAWEGLLLTSSLAEQHEAFESLEALLGNGDVTRLTVQGPNDTTWCDAQLDDEPSWEMLRPGRVMRYRVRMYSRFAYRYGERRSFASGQTAYHRGTATALPVFEVTGTMPSGYSIQSPYGTFTVTQGLTSGQTHRIDFSNEGLVYRNGVLQSGVYGHPRQMWGIPRGPGAVHTLVPVSGSGSLTTFVHDTF